MEFEGNLHQVSRVGERGDEEASTTPTRTPAQKWTVKEAEWYGDLWSYDDNEGGSHCHVWDGGLGNGEASKMPTRALPRRWTLKEEEWYANHWSYDGSTRDKVCSGEYVMERPPKKPGGTVRICLFLLSIFMAIGSAEGRGEGNDMQWSLKLWLGRMMGGIMTLLLCSIILGVTASRKKLYRLWEDVLITNQVVVPLSRAIEAFKARHNIYREEDRNIAHFVLWERFVGNFHELNEEDPKKRVELFFSKIDKDISDVITDASCEHKEAVKACIKKLHNLNQIRETPEFALDLPFWALLFILIETMYFNNLRGSLKDNSLGLAAAMILLILCYDNSNAFLDKWGAKDIRQMLKRVVDSGLYFGHLLGNSRRLGMRMTRAVSIECFLWIVRAAMLVVVWSKKGRSYMEEQVYAQIAMSVIIYLLSGNQHWVSERLKHVSAGMQRFIAYIAEGIEQIVREGRALSARVIGTLLFGNFYAYVHFYFAVMMAGRFLSDKLQGRPEYVSELPTTEFENRAGFEWKDDSMTAMTEAESLDTDTGITVAESFGAEKLVKVSFGDKSFGSSILECDTRWSTVVNGVRYYGNARFLGASSFGTADASEDTSEKREETTKERNRRLLMQDRSFQAG